MHSSSHYQRWKQQRTEAKQSHASYMHEAIQRASSSNTTVMSSHHPLHSITFLQAASLCRVSAGASQ
jgi:hypothetical protein